MIHQFNDGKLNKQIDQCKDIAKAFVGNKKATIP
jgi:hypothetical protein